MQQPKHFSAYALDARFPLDRLRELQFKKLRYAAYVGLIALAATSVWSFYLFINQPTVPIFSDVGFPEWRMEPELEALAVVDELTATIKQVVRATREFFLSVDSGQIAGTARVISSICIFLGITFSFRKFLAEHFLVYGQQLQYEDQQRMDHPASRHKWLRSVVVALSCMVSVYIITSLVWIALGEIFREFAAAPLPAAIFAASFAAVATFIAVFMSLTMTRLQLAAMAMFTFVLGLGATFAMADAENGQQWWQAAVSRAGAHPDSNWLFIITILSVVLAFTVLWYDIDQFMQRIVRRADCISPLDKVKNPLKLWFRKNAYNLIRVLYALAVVGLCGVAAVRVVQGDFLTTVIHTGGAVLSILIFAIGGLGFALWFPDEIVGKPFRRFTWACVIVYVCTLFLYCQQILNLTGAELVLLMLIGIWFYFALDTVLTYIDALIPTDEPTSC
jgi:hypothetical protein